MSFAESISEKSTCELRLRETEQDNLGQSNLVSAVRLDGEKIVVRDGTPHDKNPLAVQKIFMAMADK